MNKKTIFKKLLLISLLIFLTLTLSCMPTGNNDKDLMELKKDASIKFELARTEFFADIDSNDNEDNFTKESVGTKERIIAMAWSAYYTNDASELIKFLQDNNLYSKYDNLSEKYNLDYYYDILQMPSELKEQTKQFGDSYPYNYFEQFYDGDIYVCHGGGSSSGKLLGFFIPGHWKHAGIKDAYSAYGYENSVLSASDETTHGFGVGYESITKWRQKDAVKVLRVSGWTSTKARNGINHSKQFLGKPYNVFVSRWDDSSWYCSKVVFRAWYSVGIDVEPQSWYGRGTWVTPQDLDDSSKTYHVGGDSY